MPGYLPPLQLQEKIGDYKHVDAANGNIVIGHNQADADAPCIGKTANLRIKNGKLYADIVGINKAGLDIIKQFPYYSPDMMTEPPELLGVSLLGQTPPHFKFPPLTDYEPQPTASGYWKYVDVPIFEETIRKPNENSKNEFSFDNKWIHRVKNQFDLDKEQSIKSRFSKLNQKNRANFALPLTKEGTNMPDEIMTSEVEETGGDTEAVLGQLVTTLEGVVDLITGLPEQIAAAIKGDTAPAESEAAAEVGSDFAEEEMDEEEKKKEAEFADDTEKKDEKVEAARFARMKREVKAEIKAENDSKAHEKFIVDSCEKLHADGKIGNVKDSIARFSRMDAHDAEQEIAFLEESAPLRYLKKAKSVNPGEDKKAVFSRVTNDLFTNDVALRAYGGVDGIKEKLNGLNEKQRAALIEQFKK